MHPYRGPLMSKFRAEMFAESMTRRQDKMSQAFVEVDAAVC